MKKHTLRVRSTVILLFSTLFFVGLTSGQILSAATTPPIPRLYLQPVQQTLALNVPVIIPVRINTGGQAINAASVKLAYPTSLLEFSSVSYLGGALQGSIEEKLSTPGTIEISRYVTPPGQTVTGDVLFATLIFKAKVAGVGDVSLDATSQLLNNGISLSVSLVGVNITVSTTPTTTTPKPTNPTPPVVPPTTTKPTSGSGSSSSGSANKTGAGTTATTATTSPAATKTTTQPAKKGSALKKTLGLVGIGLGVLGVGGGLAYFLLGKKYGWFSAVATGTHGAAAGGLAAGALGSMARDNSGDKLPSDTSSSGPGIDASPPVSQSRGNDGPVVINPDNKDK